MTYTLPEPAIDKIIQQLKIALPAKITALQPTFTPTLTMRQIAEYTLGKRVAHKGFPAIELIPIESPVDLDSTETLAMRHHIGIGIVVRDGTEDNVDRLLLRYATCVVQALADRRAAQNAFAPWFLDMNEMVPRWSDLRPAGQALYELDVQFVVRMSISETRT
jgi:hypothetical protein